MSYAPTQKPITAGTSSSSDLASLRVPVMHRHRKSVSTGGGRAWSEAEEAYLIETREHKMPYKHIAAQLKKTELACRLHYHQLSFGSRARRGPSAATLHTFDRSSMTPPTSMRHSTPQRPLPSFSPPASPPQNQEYASHSTSDNAHKPILPKPIVSPQRGVQDTRALRLVTDDRKDRQYVDIARLDRIYDAHRLHIWSTVARHYGGNLSPATLEDAWRCAHGMSGSNFPPTPKGSPQSSHDQPSILTTPYSAVTDPGKGFTAVNAARESSAPRSAYPSMPSKQNSFAISSLLTEDKEVRSPSRKKRLQESEAEHLSTTTASAATTPATH